MKSNILKISILPLVFLAAIAFTGFPPQKEKGNQNGNAERKGNQSEPGNKNNKSGNSSRGNSNNAGRSDDDRGQAKGRSDENRQGGDNNKRGNDKNYNKGKSGDHMGNSDDNRGLGKNNNGNEKDKGKSRRETLKWDGNENIDWGFANYTSRKRPKDHKKVTVCHNTGDSNYPVTISVSENALKAHINHGDQVGNCNTNYSNRWPANYIQTRENVYNNYENTWETMSYSESLLRFAADKLLGIKSTFQTQRPNLSSQEIQRKEALILELQNNVNSLENQLAVTRQRTDGLNININL